MKQTEAQRRENPDPHESNRPIPRIAIAIIALALAWAVGYIALSHPGNDPALGDSRTLADLAGQKAATGAADGAQIFAAQCAACHQATGLGLPGVFPPLAGSEWVLGKETLATRILLHGISGSLTVKGSSYKGDMPAFGAKLSDAEIAAVLSHIRSNFGNNAGKVDAALVKTARETDQDRKAPWNGDEDLAKLK